MAKMNINKINNSTPVRVERNTDVKAPEKESRSTQRSNAATEDRLDFSSRGSKVRELVDQVKQMPDVRQEKVDSLRAQIAAGTYDPSNQDIAKAILDDERSK
jgi:negative regulator of flagellin synthesis FlgM